MHVEPSVEAALQECHVQELLEPSPHLNAAMEVGITHPKIIVYYQNLRQHNRCLVSSLGGGRDGRREVPRGLQPRGPGDY